ncbi:MAG: TolC family protein [Phycisphaerales bacterium]
MNRAREANRGGLLRPAMSGLAPALMLLATAGCASPFHPLDSDRGIRIAPERRRTIDVMDFAGASTPGAAPQRYSDMVEAIQNEPPAEKPPQPFEGLERYALSVEEARAIALERNLDLRVALVNPTIADQRLQEEEAAFEWTLFANARRIDTEQPTATQLEGSEVEQDSLEAGVRIPLRTGGTAQVSIPLSRTSTNNQFSLLDPSYTADARVSLSVPLLRNAGRWTNTRAIRIQALEGQIVGAQTKLAIIRELSEVERSYWRLYAAHQALDVAQQQYELAMEQYRRAERRVLAEVAPELEVIRAEAGVAERLEQIIIAQNEVLLRQRELKRLVNAPGIGIASGTMLELATEPDPVRYELNPARLREQAIANRMELLEIELRLAQDATNIDFAKNQMLPALDVDGSYALQGLGGSVSEAAGVVRDAEFPEWTLGLRFETPIGNEAAESRVAQAILARLQRLSSKASREQLIEQEVLNAVDNLESSWQRILASRQSIVAAERTLRGEQNQFDAGVRTSTDVLDAATRLAEAQLAEIRALAEYQIAQIDLAQSTGTLLGAARIRFEPTDPRTPGERHGDRINPSGPTGW